MTTKQTIQSPNEYVTVPLTELRESDSNPRKIFDPERLAELAESIREKGVLSPLVVRPVDGHFEIVAGARRYRAAREAGFKELPVRVVSLSDAEADEVRIVENLQRSDLHPFEEARGFRAILEREGTTYTVERLAAKVGKLAAFVARRIKLSAKIIINVVQVIKGVVASAVNEDGEQLYPRQWNHDFMDLPIVTDQHRPSFTGETVTAIVEKAAGRYRVLYALCAASGMRIGEALGLEIDKHILDAGLTIHLRQKAWNGQIHNFLKTANARREIDLHSSIAQMLVQFIGNRKSGLLFCTESGRPLSPSNILSDSLHPILEKLGQPKAGAHAFRRFRATWLRMQRTPEDLIRFWLGHANKTVTDGYSLLKESCQFRRKIAEQVNIGFEIPASEIDVAPKTAICTQTTSLSSAL
jgi:ParB/RepB/Spo0J family partition protein